MVTTFFTTMVSTFFSSGSEVSQLSFLLEFWMFYPIWLSLERKASGMM